MEWIAHCNIGGKTLLAIGTALNQHARIKLFAEALCFKASSSDICSYQSIVYSIYLYTYICYNNIASHIIFIPIAMMTNIKLHFFLY